MRTIASVLLFAAAASAQTSAPHHHPPRSADEYAKILEDPKRDAWQKPHDVVMALGLKPTDSIADIGAGSGYFARRFANHAGKVYAVDIDEKLLAMTAKGAPKNLVTVLATMDDPKLPEASVDVVFFCDVMHHIDNRTAYFKKLAKALRPGGRIVNVDFYKKDLPVGPPVAMKLSEAQVVGEFEAAGFVNTKNLDLLEYQYFQVFERQ